MGRKMYNYNMYIGTWSDKRKNYHHVWPVRFALPHMTRLPHPTPCTPHKSSNQSAKNTRVHKFCSLLPHSRRSPNQVSLIVTQRPTDMLFRSLLPLSTFSRASEQFSSDQIGYRRVNLRCCDSCFCQFQQSLYFNPLSQKHFSTNQVFV